MSTTVSGTAAGIVLGAYLLGSISFSYLIVKAREGMDVRTVGSGNAGATNVLRTGRKDLAAITFLGDTGKGAAAVGLALLITHLLGLDTEARQNAMALAGAAAFLGHLFPVWLKFKGGKGVATFLGTLFGACRHGTYTTTVQAVTVCNESSHRHPAAHNNFA